MLSARHVMRIVGVLAVAATASVAACSSQSNRESGIDDTARPATVASAPAATVRHLDPAAFAAAITQAGTVLLDVRTPEEFASGHLAKATNVDVQAADFAQRVASLDKSASYALYCRSGHRSGQAAEQMRAAGFGSVVDLAGGITAWTAAGQPVTSG